MPHDEPYELGRTLKRDMVSPAFAGEDPPKQVYPSLSLSSQEFPPLTDWQVGQTYEMTVKVKMTGLSERGQHQHGEFDVLSAKG